MKQFVTLLELIENNKEKAIKYLEQFSEFTDKFGENLTGTLDTLDDYSKQLLSKVSFELIETELISLEIIKEYLLKMRSENIEFQEVALLKLGYNNKSNKHEFAIQFFDENNTPIKNVQMVILKGKSVDDNLHRAFGDKELIKLK
ncbi:hypothetical protein [Winogradskyella undariae]|jgi:hypothetical protein|uniref:hypothetical protein n=1 Tax=Winogradskyella undariae TaxID=1285465 RepID=UPI0015C6F8F7|nr:hypothetical protein [Winogradskyella undariae]